MRDPTCPQCAPYTGACPQHAVTYFNSQNQPVEPRLCGACFTRFFTPAYVRLVEVTIPVCPFCNSYTLLRADAAA